MKEGYLKDIPFFTRKDDSFVALVVPYLLPWKIQEKELIYKIGDHPNQSNPFLIFKFSLFHNERQSIFRERRVHSIQDYDYWVIFW